MHTPQWASSVWVFTQVPPQFRRPLAQQIPPELADPIGQQMPPELYDPVGQHRPVEQTCVAAHALPHAPQLRTSASTFEHPRSQQVWPIPHTTPHIRQFDGSSSGTHAPRPIGPQHCASAAQGSQPPQ